MTKSGNATIAINVRHAPGRGSVSPTGPVAIEGRSAVLTCASDPPGYPEPTFEWWKGARDSRYGYFLEVGQTTQGGVGGNVVYIESSLTAVCNMFQIMIFELCIICIHTYI